MSDAPTEWRTETVVEISDANRFLKQLCRHFAHKVDVELDGSTGVKRLPGVVCTMTAESPTELRFVIDAESAERAERHQGVIERHLTKFAFRETLTFDWSEPSRATNLA